MTKRCKHKLCGKAFKPTFNSLQTCCSIGCAIALVEAEKAKVYKQRTRELKLKAREHDRGWHIKTLQPQFNKFIRLRDRNESCISCDPRAIIEYAAGHYRTTAACPELRFCEDNVNKKCSRNCNQSRSGNVAEYRLRLVKKIGIEKVEWLEGPHKPKKYTIEELKGMTSDYRQRIRQLEKEAA